MEAPVVETEESKAQRKYTELGVVSVVCGIVGLIFLVLMFLPGIMILSFFVPALGVLAIVFGSVSYWGMKRDSLGLTGFGLGALLIIVWFLIVAYLNAFRLP